MINHAVRRVEEGMLLFLNDRLSNTVIILYFWYLLSCITKKKQKKKTHPSGTSRFKATFPVPQFLSSS